LSELFSSLLSLLPVPTHHVLDLLSLLDGRVQVPLLCLELLVLLLDGLNFFEDLLDLFLEECDSLFAFLPDLFDLLLEGFELVFVHFGVFLAECDLHFLLDFEHLYFLDHGGEFVDVFLLLFKVETFLGDLDLAGLDFLHDSNLFVGLVLDFVVLLVNLGLGNEECILQIGDWLFVVNLNLPLLDSDFDVEVGLAFDEELLDGLEFRLIFASLPGVVLDGLFQVLHG
jgi:hypothetical protein